VTIAAGRAALALATALVAVAAAGGCGGDDPARAPQAETDATPTPPAPATRPEPATPAPPRAQCPARTAPGCRSAAGRIIAVEAVDPDGDGDAHFVLAGRDSVTAPGITVVDVRRDLRPDPLPGLGERISAAGPVYPGSYGQRQIEAVALELGG